MNPLIISIDILFNNHLTRLNKQLKFLNSFSNSQDFFRRFFTFLRIFFLTIYIQTPSREPRLLNPFTNTVDRFLLSEWRFSLRPSLTYGVAPTFRNETRLEEPTVHSEFVWAWKWAWNGTLSFLNLSRLILNNICFNPSNVHWKDNLFYRN